MKVLIIPEDPALDQHILKPIVERIFKDLGKTARVEVLQNPRLRGVAQALDKKQVDDIVDNYSMHDLFLLMVDNDCDESHASLATQRVREHEGRLIACLAKEEVEVWMLALHRDYLKKELGVGVREVREHCDPKEAFAEPFLRRLSGQPLLGGGRKKAMRAAEKSWRGLFSVCEELDQLKNDIQAWLTARVS